jgi:hypothetical protein
MSKTKERRRDLQGIQTSRHIYRLEKGSYTSESLAQEKRIGAGSRSRRQGESAIICFPGSCFS